jgi:hypothetical protein
MNDKNLEPDISRTKPISNLTLQDALIAITVYASQTDPANCEGDVNRIVALARNHELFNENSEATRARINKFVEHMNADKSNRYVDLAAASLPSKLKKIAFSWAVELSLDQAGSLEEKQNRIDDLRIRLGIDNLIARQLINKIEGKAS